MITKFETWDTDRLEDYRDDVEFDYIEKCSDPRWDMSIVVGLREELIVIDNELGKRGV